MKILHLTLKKKWFDLIISGVKREEYREIKDYWARRLIRTDDSDGIEFQVWDEMLQDMKDIDRHHRNLPNLLNYFEVKFKEFDVIQFRNGYNKDAPRVTVEIKEITIGLGNIEWGAPEGRLVYILRLGHILENVAP